MAVFQLLPPVDPADRERQTAWRQRNVDKIKASRAYRLKHLAEEREAIVRATQAYQLLDHGNATRIVLRNRFIHLPTPRQATQVEEPTELPAEAQRDERSREIASRPPLTRLVHRQSNAMSLYLTAIYLAHLETEPGKLFNNRRRKNMKATDEGGRAWVRLAGLTAPSDTRTRRARMRRALDELEHAHLVRIRPPAAHYRYENWTLLSEDGSDSPYRRPSETEQDAIVLPPTFFLRGWHLVLTPGEIAMLLAIMHTHWRLGGSIEPDGQRGWVALPQSVRRHRYGLSGEIYLHAQQLREFGLVEFNDPMPSRRRGKIADARVLPPPAAGIEAPELQPTKRRPRQPLPYYFKPALATVFDQEAFKVVTDTLNAFTTPFRFDEMSEISEAQALVKPYLEAKQAAAQAAKSSSGLEEVTLRPQHPAQI